MRLRRRAVAAAGLAASAALLLTGCGTGAPDARPDAGVAAPSLLPLPPAAGPTEAGASGPASTGSSSTGEASPSSPAASAAGTSPPATPGVTVSGAELARMLADGADEAFALFTSSSGTPQAVASIAMGALASVRSAGAAVSVDSPGGWVSGLPDPVLAAVLSPFYTISTKEGQWCVAMTFVMPPRSLSAADSAALTAGRVRALVLPEACTVHLDAYNEALLAPRASSAAGLLTQSPSPAPTPQ